MNIVNIDKEKSSYLPNNLKKFRESFRKNRSYDNIKSPKKQSFTLSVENTVLEKPKGRGASV